MDDLIHVQHLLENQVQCQYFLHKILFATSGFPIVNVPVLSKITVSALLKSFITSLPFKSTPLRAPFPIPETFETGTPITNAPGHPKTSAVIASSTF